jgi:hypothetical protein
MSTRPDLADPSYEPSDEELIGLAQRAFADVRQKHESSLIRLRQEIAEERARALARLAARRGTV